MGCNLWTRPRYARAPKGQRAAVNVPTSPGKSVTLFAALSPLWGVVLFQCLPDALTAEKLKEFMQALVESLKNRFPQTRFVCVLDNCRVHSEQVLTEVVDGAQGAGFKHLFLPVYSPMLNPIELAFNKIKGALRMALVENRAQLNQTDTLPWGQKTHTRRQILFQLLTNAVTVVSVADSAQLYEKSLSFYPRSLNLENL